MLGELKQLRAFLAIARLGNFTRAAYELHISQSALTMQIQQLEAQLGVSLFDRNRRLVGLTPKGQELRPHIEHVVAEMENLITHARSDDSSKRGIVTVAALPSVAAGLLPKAIRLLHRKHPQITIRIRDTSAVHVTDMTLSEEVDFGIGSQVRHDAELAWETLMTDHFYAFAAPDYPFPATDRTTLTDLAKHPLVLPVRESSVRIHIEAAAVKEKIMLTAAYEAVHNSTILMVAAECLGIAILSDLVERGECTTRLRRIAIDTPHLYRPIGILRRTGRTLSQSAELFIEALRTTTNSTSGLESSNRLQRTAQPLHRTDRRR